MSTRTPYEIVGMFRRKIYSNPQPKFTYHLELENRDPNQSRFQVLCEAREVEVSPEAFPFHQVGAIVFVEIVPEQVRIFGTPS